MSCSRSCPNGKTNKQEPRVTDSQPARQTDGRTDSQAAGQQQELNKINYT